MPDKRNANTVTWAVHSISGGKRNSPIGTAKNKNPNGNRICPVTDQPKSAGTESTSNATNVSWVTALTATRSPKSQKKATPAIRTQAAGAGRGTCFARAPRCRQINQSTIGGTKNPCVNVSDRDQIVTIATAVSRYKNKIQTCSKTNAGRARCQARGRPKRKGFARGRVLIPGSSPPWGPASWQPEGANGARQQSEGGIFGWRGYSGESWHACRDSIRSAKDSARTPSFS